MKHHKKIFIRMLIYSMIVCISNGVVCSSMSPIAPNTNTDSDTCSRVQKSVSGYSVSEAYNTIVGKTSGDIYLAGYSNQGSTYKTMISRYTAAGALVYTVAYPNQILLQSFAVTATEWIMFYLENGNPFVFMVANCNNGSFSNRVSNLLATSTSYYCNLLQNTATSYIYFSMETYGTTSGTLCRHIIGYDNFLCLGISGTLVSRTVSYITADEVYSTTIDSANTNMWMQRTNYASNSIVWLKSYSCSSSGSCGMGHSRSLVSSDQSKIYTMSSFGVTGLVYPMFLTLNAVNGVPVSTTYIINIDCAHIFSMVIKSNDVFSTGLCSSNSYIFQINVNDSTLKFYKFSSTQIRCYNMNIYPNTNRLLIVGSNSGNEWYEIQVAINAIDQHPDISNSTLQYSTENSVSKVSDASSLTSVTINNDHSTGIGGTQTIPAPTMNTNSTAGFSSLVSFHLDPVIKTEIIAETSYQIPIELTCVLSLSTTITYSLCSYEDSSPPTWVSLDDINCKLNFIAEKQPTQKTYIFAINSIYTGSTKQSLKPVYLTVNAVPLPTCQVLHCTECKWYDGTKCKTCDTGYTILNSIETKCEIIPKTNSTTSTTVESATTMAVSGTSAAAVIILSCFNLSSITILWAIFSQLRTLLYLILTDAYLPDSVVEYLKGMKIFTFSFSFFSLQNFPLIKTGINLFDIPNQSQVLSQIGLDSQSSIVNNINLAMTVLMIIILHIILFVESSQILLISCVSEIYDGDSKSTYKTISLFVSILLFLFCLTCWVIIFIKWIKVDIKKIKEDAEDSMFVELFKGT